MYRDLCRQVPAWNQQISAEIQHPNPFSFIDYAILGSILGHELAHNFLKTREQLDAKGTSFGLFSAFGTFMLRQFFQERRRAGMVDE